MQSRGSVSWLNSSPIVAFRLGDCEVLWAIGKVECHAGVPLIEHAEGTQVIREMTEAPENVRALLTRYATPDGG